MTQWRLWGSAVEYAVLSLNIAGQEFLDLFLTSGIAGRFGQGDAMYLSGMSGIELARKVLTICGKTIPAYTENSSCHYSPEYWVGWILAYYQWYCGKPFSMILPKLRYQSLRNLYGVLHEADPSKAASVFDELLSEQAETNLARYRKARGLSQSQLAMRPAFLCGLFNSTSSAKTISITHNTIGCRRWLKPWAARLRICWSKASFSVRFKDLIKVYPSSSHRTNAF